MKHRRKKRIDVKGEKIAKIKFFLMLKETEKQPNFQNKRDI